MSNLQDCVNATLEDWNNIKEKYQSSGLLVGNGASLGIWDKFRYASLYDKAKSNAQNPLSGADMTIFESMKTKDFERVLAGLWTTEVVCKALEQDTQVVCERYESIQNALIEAVHAVHVTWLEAEKVLTKIHSSLLQYTSVYSTNYDLLLYWAIMTKKPIIFKDYFWSWKTGHIDLEDLELSPEEKGYFDIIKNRA